MGILKAKKMVVSNAYHACKVLFTTRILGAREDLGISSYHNNQVS